MSYFAIIDAKKINDDGREFTSVNFLLLVSCENGHLDVAKYFKNKYSIKYFLEEDQEVSIFCHSHDTGCDETCNVCDEIIEWLINNFNLTYTKDEDGIYKYDCRSDMRSAVLTFNMNKKK